MLILPDSETVFISVPKTAGTSMHYSLNTVGYNHPEPEEYHMSAARLLEEHPEVKNYFKFGFVRNPYDRLVSLWHDFKNRGVNYSEKVTLDKPLLDEYSTFQEFVLDLPNFMKKDDVHFRPQHTFLCEPENPYDKVGHQLIVDMVGKFENLEEDFKHIVSKRALRVVKPFTVNNSTKHDDYNSYYDNINMIKSVIQIFWKDFKIFGYDYGVNGYNIASHNDYYNNNTYSEEIAMCKNEKCEMFSIEIEDEKSDSYPNSHSSV